MPAKFPIRSSAFFLLPFAFTPALLAAPEPSTRPATAHSPTSYLHTLLDHTRQAVNDLGNLSDEQKQKTDQLLSDAKDRLQKLDDEIESFDLQGRMAKAREFMTDTRKKLDEVLTPDQRRQFQQKLYPHRPGAAPTTAPARSGQEGAGAFFQRLRDAASQLDLSDDQKEKLQSLASDLREKIQSLRKDLTPGTDEFREKARALVQDAMTQIRSILNEDQQRKLRELLQKPRSGHNLGPTTQARRKEQNDMTMESMDSMESRAPVHRDAQGSAAPKEHVPLPTPAIGSAAPELAVTALDGQPLTLSHYRGKPLILIFASYSTPSFRHKAGALNDFAKSVAPSANLLVIYTKEAHPSNGPFQVERNKEEGIEIPQAKTEQERLAMAERARQSLHLQQIPFAVDALNDKTASAYNLLPNGAALIDKQGKIVAIEHWFEPDTMQQQIEELLRSTPNPAASL